MQTGQDNESQLILVQNNLRTLPLELVRKHSGHTELLDLSHNSIKDLSWLAEFEQLRHLVLDSNRMHEAHLRTLSRPLPQLEVLMLNKNEFSDLPTTTRLIKRLFPNLQYLSLHGNPICPDGLELQPFSGYLRYDYQYYSNYIAQSLSKLKFLDHGLVQRTYQYESFPLKNYDGRPLVKTTSF
nr:leucine-rich melanocyte differentiation-associated protein [Drosophila bipectinata]